MRKNRYYFGVAAALLTIQVSCMTDNVRSYPDPENRFSVAEAKEFFEGQMSSLSATRSDVAPTPFEGIIIPKDYEPEWDRAIASRKGNIASVDVPIITPNTAYVTRAMLIDYTKHVSTVDITLKVLVVKNTVSGKMAYYIMSLIPDEDYAAANPGDLSLKVINGGPKGGFSGFIIYSYATSGLPVQIDRYSGGRKVSGVSMWDKGEGEPREKFKKMLAELKGMEFGVRQQATTRLQEGWIDLGGGFYLDKNGTVWYDCDGDGIIDGIWIEPMEVHYIPPFDPIDPDPPLPTSEDGRDGEPENPNEGGGNGPGGSGTGGSGTGNGNGNSGQNPPSGVASTLIHKLEYLNPNSQSTLDGPIISFLRDNPIGAAMAPKLDDLVSAKGVNLIIAYNPDLQDGAGTTRCILYIVEGTGEIVGGHIIITIRDYWDRGTILEEFFHGYQRLNDPQTCTGNTEFEAKMAQEYYGRLYDTESEDNDSYWKFAKIYYDNPTTENWNNAVDVMRDVGYNEEREGTKYNYDRDTFHTNNFEELKNSIANN